LRERIAEDRKLFMNSGPWQTPWPEAPQFAPPVDPRLTPPGTESGASEEPPEWDNGWYYRGW
jgi:hypothetical protein